MKEYALSREKIIENLFCVYTVHVIMTKSLYLVGLCIYCTDDEKMSRERKVEKDVYEIYSFIRFTHRKTTASL